jgi:diguanylate cyclase (GGDEF)-like protein
MCQRVSGTDKSPVIVRLYSVPGSNVAHISLGKVAPKSLLTSSEGTLPPMRVLLRLTAVLTLVVALLIIALNRDAIGSSAAFLPEIAFVAIIAIIGFLIGTWRRAQDVHTGESPLDLTMTSDAPAHAIDPINEKAVVSFAKSLLAAAATPDLRNTIESQMSALLQGRRVFVVWGGQQQPVSAAAAVSRPHTAALNDPIQEWTTFSLQVDGQPHGVLGVESCGGLPAELKQRIQGLTPLISQSLRTAQDVDGFREASVVDLLTGAATRREGLNRLQTEVKRAQRTGSTMAVLMIDLDHFKSINDRFGHALGDNLLTAIGQTLVRTLRASDVRCRWGGEEFLIILPETSLSQAQVVATNLLNNVAATAVPSTKGPVSSTASIGLTISRPAETDVQRIVGRADMALYEAKHAGRGCVRVVLGGLDGEPLGVDPVRKGPTTRVADNKLPFPDRRDPNRLDRRRVPGPGRRSTDRRSFEPAGPRDDAIAADARRTARA